MILRPIKGKYSQRRRNSVAVIIIRILFISSFLFYCLLLNHSFSTNPNKITNCFQLFSLLQLYNYIAPASLFDFLNRSKFSGINGEYGGSFECDAVCVKISKAYGIIASNTSGKLNNCEVERSGWSGIISDCLTGKYL